MLLVCERELLQWRHQTLSDRWESNVRKQGSGRMINNSTVPR